MSVAGQGRVPVSVTVDLADLIEQRVRLALERQMWAIRQGIEAEPPGAGYYAEEVGRYRDRVLRVLDRIEHEEADR